MNTVVARLTDGRMVKGTTVDFVPTKDRFHVSVEMATAGSKIRASSRDRVPLSRMAATCRPVASPRTPAVWRREWADGLHTMQAWGVLR
jgi:hypothetical protein